MAINAHRFQFRGPSSAEVTRKLGVYQHSVTRAINPPPLTATIYEDYYIDDGDLDIVIAILSDPHGWEYVGPV